MSCVQIGPVFVTEELFCLHHMHLSIVDPVFGEEVGTEREKRTCMAGTACSGPAAFGAER